MKRSWLCVAAALLAATAAPAQQSGTEAPCRDAAAFLSPAEQRYCFAIAQAVESAQPQLGILLAAGNPTLGTHGTGAIRLGTLPRFNASGKLSAVRVRLPDIEEQSTATAEQLELLAPAVSGAVAVGLLPGFSVSPTLAGIGSVDLLGSATWLPFRLIDVGGFSDAPPDFAFGVGARLGLLRESFTAPGVVVSLMYRRLGRVQYGDVCPGGAGASLLSGAGEGYRLDAGLCAARDDRGEFAFDLSNWSGRATVGKRLLGLGLAAGLGYDRFRSDIDLGLGATPELPVLGPTPVFVRASELELESDRWSAFANGSYSVLLARLVAEIGWMQGSDAISGFDPSRSEFNPGDGIVFGSVGVSFGL